MKRFWFHGIMPADTIEEEKLTTEQIKIIEYEKKNRTPENIGKSWLGYKNDSGWDFMKHGHQVIHIKEEKGNIARKKFNKLVFELYY